MKNVLLSPSFLLVTLLNVQLELILVEIYWKVKIRGKADEIFCLKYLYENLKYLSEILWNIFLFLKFNVRNLNVPNLMSEFQQSEL